MRFMRKFLLLIYLLSVLAVVAGLVGVRQWHMALHQPLVLPEPERTLLVGKGDTLSEVVYRLADEGVLQYPRYLVWYARWNKATLIRTGEYLLTPDLTGQGLLERLASGRVRQYQVTFPEGWKLSQAMAVLEAQPKLINDVKDMNAAEYFDTFGFMRVQAEGWFYPDTYSFVSGNKISEVLLQAHRRMRVVLDEEWQKRADNLPYKNPYEALIVASLIEKETGVASERTQIAGVFVRRLQKGMKLQTDPAVIYGLGDAFDGDLKKRHLKESTPYNTYVIDGLPPTPIAMVGREAIQAALHPAGGKAIFFVARGDGTSIFTETLNEHEAAVDTFQRRRSENYSSSPPPSITESPVQATP
jgi:UPF0755 protein